MTIKAIAAKLGFDYHRIFEEVGDLEKLGKVVKVKHEGETMVLWKDEDTVFEYELSHNIVKIRKVLSQFICTPSEKRQVKFPTFVYKELKQKIGFTKKFDLMLEVKAVCADGIWYKIETEKIGE